MNQESISELLTHPDPITGAPGSHPIGTGIGAAAGGIAAGAAVGTMAGPVGTAVGVAVGAVVGGLAGKGVAEAINPTIEDAYWRNNHPYQSYSQGRPYEEFSSAYRTGYEAYSEFSATGTFEIYEDQIRERYERTQPKLLWQEARPASRAAWLKFETIKV